MCCFLNLILIQTSNWSWTQHFLDSLSRIYPQDESYNLSPHPSLGLLDGHFWGRSQYGGARCTCNGNFGLLFEQSIAVHFTLRSSPSSCRKVSHPSLGTDTMAESKVEEDLKQTTSCSAYKLTASNCFLHNIFLWTYLFYWSSTRSIRDTLQEWVLYNVYIL